MPLHDDNFRGRHLPCCLRLRVTQHGVENGDELAHDGDDRLFAVLDEPFIESAQSRIVASCAHGSHEERAFDGSASAGRSPVAAHEAAIAGMGGAASEAAGLSARQGSKLWHVSKKHDGGFLADAFEAGHPKSGS